MKDIKKLVQKASFSMRGMFISTYIPRHCGIATYTKDLTNAINVLNDSFAEVMALDDRREPVSYPWEVKYRIDREDEKDYLHAANYINRSSCDYVSLQHEYGIFGGNSGENILSLIRNLKKPLITTFHTTLKTPNEEQEHILKKIADSSDACVVMIKEAAKRLVEVYKIPDEKIVVIPHGVPNIPFSPSHMFKKQIGFSKDDFLIGSINLIAPNKGLEYLIMALPEIKKVHPNVKFLMIGATHPLVKAENGEEYRNYLKSLITKYKLQDNFVEINKYISLDQLIDYLKALDVYITPYLDKNQTSSGTLAYAIGAGKICVATPYIYAKEILKKDRGILVPPRDSKAIALAVKKVITNETYRHKIEQNAYDFGRHMIWERVALDYLHLFSFVVHK